MNNKLTIFTKGLLDIIFYIGIGIELSIPVLFRFFGLYAKSFRDYYIPQCIIYMISGIFTLMIVQELRKVFITVLNENAFVDSNTESLKKMSICSFIISLLSIIRLIFSLTPATFMVILVFFIAGLFSMVLCQVFKTAIHYKRENDLTI